MIKKLKRFIAWLQTIPLFEPEKASIDRGVALMRIWRRENPDGCMMCDYFGRIDMCREHRSRIRARF